MKVQIDDVPIETSESQSGRHGSGVLAPTRKARSVSLTRLTFTPQSTASVATASEQAIADETSADQDGVRSKRRHLASCPERDR